MLRWDYHEQNSTRRRVIRIPTGRGKVVLPWSTSCFRYRIITEDGRAFYMGS